MPRASRLTRLVCPLLVIGFLATAIANYMVSVSLLKRSLTESILPLTSDNIYSEIQKDLIQPVVLSSQMAANTFIHDWVWAGERDKAQMLRYLQGVHEEFGTVTTFFVSERSRIHYLADRVLKRVRDDDPDEQWYFQARDSKEPYLLNVAVDETNRAQLTVFINHRVVDREGKFLGVIGCGLTISRITALLKNYEQRYHRHIYFVDADGQIALSASTNSGSISASSGLAELAAGIFSADQASHSYERDGETVLLNTRYLPELKLFLFVEQSLAGEMSLLRRTLLINLLLCLVISVVILFAVQRTLGRYQRRIEEMATIDRLTGLHNRNAGESLFAQALRESQRRKTPLTVILLDLDHFKRINDQHGHLVGDAVLAACARILRSRLRDMDIVTRWGGEEFLLVLKDCLLEDGILIAEKIRVAMMAEEIHADGAVVRFTASLGVAERLAAEDGQQLLQRADEALYLAKSNGRNRTEAAVATPGEPGQ